MKEGVMVARHEARRRGSSYRSIKHAAGCVRRKMGGP